MRHYREIRETCEESVKKILLSIIEFGTDRLMVEKILEQAAQDVLPIKLYKASQLNQNNGFQTN